VTDFYLIGAYLDKAAKHPKWVKVGHSTDLVKRIKQLDTGSPHPLVSWDYHECQNKWDATSMENSFKAQFSRQRVKNEWFIYIEKMDDFVENYIKDRA
jgi:hypothetical protein